MSRNSCIMQYLLVFLLVINVAISRPEETRTYIIHMDHSQKPKSFLTHESWHKSTLNSLSSSSASSLDDSDMLLYSYNHVMHGFSAKLTLSQLTEIENSPAHVATYNESFGKLFTTHTPEFLGLKTTSGLWPAAAYGEDVIIGVIDTGIWPESQSFGDSGMLGVPERWKGACENGTAFSTSDCNNKLIGARSFSKGLIAAGRKISTEFDFDSPRDFFGHGTHTSSTAAGNHVLGVSYFGYAAGTARGIAPAAHLAMYKVLFATDTLESAATDVLAGMDQAIADGVDIMSISLGFDQTPYFSDVIAIGSLSAIEKGIVVVCAAGNDGGYNTTHNGAPWIFTVGAGTIDRSFVATLALGNGLIFEGISYYPESILISNSSLYYGGSNLTKAICNYNAFQHRELAGMVVFCDNTTQIDISGQIEVLQKAGALAGIFLSDMTVLAPDEYFIPSIILPTSAGISIRDYVTQIGNATVKSLKFVTTKIGSKPAPEVAFFSSKGPDPITPGILKPDILAPGVDILAAFSPRFPFIQTGPYGLVTDYALLSGTSMAAPHVAGVSALVKSVHRDWSPAAIRSAIMTTAYNRDNTNSVFKDQWTGNYATPLAYGAGHVNPNAAMNPGLIYDMDGQDYINFICNLGYTDKQISAVIRQSNWTCSHKTSDLNYPSFVAIFSKDSGILSKNFSRAVTNVGDEDLVAYQAVLEIPDGMRVTVEPETIVFSSKNQEQGYVLNVEIDSGISGVIYGYLKWVDEHKHVVSSPIVVISS